MVIPRYTHENFRCVFCAKSCKTNPAFPKINACLACRHNASTRRPSISCIVCQCRISLRHVDHNLGIYPTHCLSCGPPPLPTGSPLLSKRRLDSPSASVGPPSKFVRTTSPTCDASASHVTTLAYTVIPRRGNFLTPIANPVSVVGIPTTSHRPALLRSPHRMIMANITSIAPPSRHDSPSPVHHRQADATKVDVIARDDTPTLPKPSPMLLSNAEPDVIQSSDALSSCDELAAAGKTDGPSPTPTPSRAPMRGCYVAKEARQAHVVQLDDVITTTPAFLNGNGIKANAPMTASPSCEPGSSSLNEDAIEAVEVKQSPKPAPVRLGARDSGNRNGVARSGVRSGVGSGQNDGGAGGVGGGSAPQGRRANVVGKRGVKVTGKRKVDVLSLVDSATEALAGNVGEYVTSVMCGRVAERLSANICDGLRKKLPKNIKKGVADGLADGVTEGVGDVMPTSVAAGVGESVTEAIEQKTEDEEC